MLAGWHGDEKEAIFFTGGAGANYFGEDGDSAIFLNTDVKFAGVMWEARVVTGGYSVRENVGIIRERCQH